jgi:hypothetical protein
MNIEEKLKVISETGEIWKPMPDFESKYLISSHGRVLGIGTYNTCKKGELIKLHKKNGRNGYIQGRFHDNGRAKTIEIHSLVAKAFMPNPNNYPMINHIDKNKTNNHVENLEWCNNVYNTRYSNAIPIDVYTKDGNFVESFEAIIDASIKYNIPTSNISRCIKSKYGTAYGYQFRLKGEKFAPKPLKIKHVTNPKEYYYVSVDEYDLNGNIIKTWENITSASKEYNIPATNISKCWKGKILTTNNKIFIRHEENINERLLKIKNKK